MSEQTSSLRRPRLLRSATVLALTMFIGVASGPRQATPAAPRGDAARGAALFARLPCTSCHDITKPWPGGDICPNLGNIAAEAGRIVRSPGYRGKARDAAGYIRESIIDPNAY